MRREQVRLVLDAGLPPKLSVTVLTDLVKLEQYIDNPKNQLLAGLIMLEAKLAVSKKLAVNGMPILEHRKFDGAPGFDQVVSYLEDQEFRMPRQRRWAKSRPYRLKWDNQIKKFRYYEI